MENAFAAKGWKLDGANRVLLVYRELDRTFSKWLGGVANSGKGARECVSRRENEESGTVVFYS